MNEKIKTQLRVYLDLKLRLCKAYMQEHDLAAAKTVWQQAFGAAEFASASAFGIYYDWDFSAELDSMWENDYRNEFEKTLFPEVET